MFDAVEIAVTTAMESVFISRQAAFDKNGAVWCWSLQFKRSELSDACADPLSETAQLIVDGIAAAKHGLPADARFLIDLPAALLEGKGERLLPQNCGAHIEAGNKPTEEILLAVAVLKKNGHMTAVSVPCHRAWLDAADVVAFDFSTIEHDKIAQAVGQVQDMRLKLFARGLADKASYDLALELGFSYFEGSYFQKADVTPGKTPPPAAWAKFELLHKLRDEEFDVKDLSDVVGRDVALSYRLLAFVNSAAFGVRERVDSIKRAIDLLGFKQIRLWLMAVTVSDSSGSEKIMELNRLGVQRARFFELLAEKKPEFREMAGLLTLMGLLSKIDAVFGAPMHELADKLPLPEEAREALCGAENRLSVFLRLAETIEAGEWGGALELLMRLGVKPNEAAVAHNLAALWANELLASVKLSPAA